MSQCKLCQAIEGEWIVEFDYEGDQCSMCPYVLFRRQGDGEKLLGGFQGAPSHRWRRYVVSKIMKPKITNSPFLPDVTFDPYSPEYEDFICRAKKA